MTLSTLCENIGLNVPLSHDCEIEGIAPLDLAQPTHLSYITSEKYHQDLPTTKAAALFCKERDLALVPKSTLAIVVDNPELFMAYASAFFKKDLSDHGNHPNCIDSSSTIHPNAVLAGNVTIGKNCIIMAGAFLGEDVIVGDNTIIHPNVTIYHETEIGSRCLLKAGCVIGADGFGFAHTAQGEHIRIHHRGKVVIEDDVEIGSNTSIDRALFKTTLIQKGSKIDSLVMISHNVVVGEHCIIVAQTGIAGSASLGRNVTMAAQSGSVGHVHIADFSTIAARGGVTKNTEKGKTYAGFPMMEHKLWLKLQARIQRLLKG